ncbi:hypothetical protein H1R20_g12655, partial [Candolleomyces eurysporus]
MTDTQDVDADILFDESEWIRTGRLWPKEVKDVPAGLAAFREEHITLPEDIINQLQEIKKLTAEGLLNYPLR